MYSGIIVMSLSFTDSPTSLSNYLDCKQRGVTGAKRGAIKWAISRELVSPEGECVISDHDPFMQCGVLAALTVRNMCKA